MDWVIPLRLRAHDLGRVTTLSQWRGPSLPKQVAGLAVVGISSLLTSLLPLSYVVAAAIRLNCGHVLSKTCS